MSAFAAKCGELAKEEVQQFEQVYHYVSAMVAHAFPTLEQFRVEQAKEKDIADVIAYLELPEGEERTKAKVQLAGHYSGRDLKFMRLREGVLFYTNEYGTGEVLTDAVVVPKSMKQRVLKALHDSPFYGHAGLQATLLAVKEQCYWSKMVKDIRQYVRNCEQCCKAKACRRTHGGMSKRR